MCVLAITLTAIWSSGVPFADRVACACGAKSVYPPRPPPPAINVKRTLEGSAIHSVYLLPGYSNLGTRPIIIRNRLSLLKTHDSNPIITQLIRKKVYNFVRNTMRALGNVRKRGQLPDGWFYWRNRTRAIDTFEWSSSGPDTVITPLTSGGWQKRKWFFF